MIESQGEAVLVDTPYDVSTTTALQEACTSVLPPGTRLSTLINTHSNGDHSWGNSLFPDAAILTSASNAAQIPAELSPSDMSRFLTDPGTLGWYARRNFDCFSFTDVKISKPTHTFIGDYSLRIGEHALHLIEVGPAHTDGDVIVYLPREGVVIAGDVIFHGDHPMHWQGPIEHIIAACEAILVLDPEVVIPGHGRPMHLHEVRGHARYLSELRDRLHHEHASGRSAYEAANHILRSDFYPELGAPERVVALAEVEFSHIDHQGRPDAEELANLAAEWAFDAVYALESNSA